VLPPNRLEPGNWELALTAFTSIGGDANSRLKAVLRQRLGTEHVFLAPSARCAIAQLVSLLPQPEVVMPAFNCDVVKSAVEAAGKRIVYIDVASGSVNSTAAEFRAAARPGRIFLITHQFGVPTDVEAICEIARNNGCVTIEDAACCFGAVRNGRPLGTFADFGVFSFENWKRLAAFRGGVIAVNNPSHFDPSLIAAKPFVPTSRKFPSREIVAAAGRNLATIPSLYGRVVLPKLIENYFKPATPFAGGGGVTQGAAFTREFHPYQARLVLGMIRRLEHIRNHIAQLVAIYQRAFAGSGITPLLPANYDAAGLLRFPIFFSNQSRAAALRAALKRGIYLETEFEQPLPDASELSDFPHSVRTGRDSVLLPLYTSLSLKDAAWLAGQIVEIGAESD
jgi:dTDP-4-amino-4,6-dideoxygalactose transaminase